MDKATLRPVVLEILNAAPQTHFHAIEHEVRRRIEGYERHHALILQEILWDLLLQRVLAPGKNSLNLHLPFVHVTEYGAQCLQSGEQGVHDPDRYLQRLERAVGRPLDPETIHTVSDALTVFLSGKPAVAVVLLARVIEGLFDQLADLLLRADAPSCEAWGDLVSAPRASRRRAQAVMACLPSCPLPREIHDHVEPQLNGLLVPLQMSRHPDGSARRPVVSHDQTLGLFLQFPEQCAFAYHLIDSLETTRSP